MVAIVDQETCIGCGACISASPELFEMNEEGKSVPVQETVPENMEEEAQDTAGICPVDAIKVE